MQRYGETMDYTKFSGYNRQIWYEFSSLASKVFILHP